MRRKNFLLALFLFFITTCVFGQTEIKRSVFISETGDTIIPKNSIRLNEEELKFIDIKTRYKNTKRDTACESNNEYAFQVWRANMSIRVKNNGKTIFSVKKIPTMYLVDGETNDIYDRGEVYINGWKVEGEKSILLWITYEKVDINKGYMNIKRELKKFII